MTKVPVGGSFVASPNKNFIVQLGKLYPGRASIAPALDIFITLLSLGKKNYVEYLKERISVFNYFQSCIEKLSLEYPIKLLNTPDNDISIGILLENLENNSTMIGSMMFHRLISGARVVDGSRKTQTSICGYEFKSFGSHIDEYAPYLTVAAAIGMKKDEVDQFIKIFEKILKSDSFKNVTSSALHVQS